MDFFVVVVVVEVLVITDGPNVAGAKTIASSSLV